MTINEFFTLNNKAAVALSGGVDSVYLLYEAVRALADVKAYYVRSAFQPAFELEDARSIADRLGVDMRVIELDVLSDEKIAANPADRCYYCKRRIMGAILEAAHSDGYMIVCDGTNASDDISDRPGYKALTELGIRSPLRECGLTKNMIREASRAAGLETWNKPAYACLATRIAQGEQITAKKLAVTERAERLLYEMGFTDFRIRMRGGAALVQVTGSQHEKVKAQEDEIRHALAGMYTDIRIDEKTR